MKLRFAWLVVLVACATACTQRTREPAVVGAHEDAHGCRASGGYAWCARTNQCERPWELAQKERIENSQVAFEAFCAPEAPRP